MIYVAAYAAVSVFCWGWWFAWWQGAWRNDWSADYRVDAIFSLVMAVIWIGSLLPGLFFCWSRGLWHGWRLPYIERAWRKG